MNHRQDWCRNTRSNEVNDEPLFTASHVLKEHSELAATIRECGIWPRHRPLAVFWSPAKTRDRSREFNVSSQDTLLGRVTKRVKLDDGSHLNVMDDSDFTDFIHHHACFEGDEVALPQKDRVYLLGNLTGQTPKKREMTQSSDLKDLNVACSFPTETDRHKLDPDCNGADELVPDELSLDDEHGCDSETSARKPVTSSQKQVTQNIHNICGHPS